VSRRNVCAGHSHYRRTSVSNEKDKHALLIPRCRDRDPGGPPVRRSGGDRHASVVQNPTHVGNVLDALHVLGRPVHDRLVVDIDRQRILDDVIPDLRPEALRCGAVRCGGLDLFGQVVESGVASGGAMWAPALASLTRFQGVEQQVLLFDGDQSRKILTLNVLKPFCTS
jgi:hypothetical protein